MEALRLPSAASLKKEMRVSSSLFFRILLKLGFGFLNNRAEPSGVSHGKLRQDLAIQSDFSLFQTINQTTVRKSVLPGGSVDAGNPEAPKIPLFGLAVTVGITKSSVYCLGGTAE